MGTPVTPVLVKKSSLSGGNKGHLSRTNQNLGVSAAAQTQTSFANQQDTRVARLNDLHPRPNTDTHFSHAAKPAWFACNLGDFRTLS
jgi:hypothetical protein